MGYTDHAKPFVLEKIALAEQARKNGNEQKAFGFLEDAHVIGQKSTYLHCLVHCLMLKQGFSKLNLMEIVGQAFRLIGAFTKTRIGLLPTGNTGGVNVSPFKAMPISADNQKIIKAIERQIQH
ncbi:DUF3703 domain-containing protein [Aliiglaciecola sp. NS0011-25]|uniref:DUF3703 domain-containing protein n=1 Tax=Aliiglaciecola sp. NS0011-25 TaxID=3127654 RepID=UPI003109BAE2